MGEAPTISRERPTAPDLVLLMERHTADMPQEHIPRANRQLTRQVSIGGAVVAAATGLVEEELPVLAFELINERQRCIRRHDTFHHDRLP